MTGVQTCALPICFPVTISGVTLLEGVTDLVKVKALIKATSKGIKEVITRSGKKDKDGTWTENTIRELFKD